MRLLVAVVVFGSLAGCFAAAAGGDGKSRPGVMPLLSELPGDAEKRDAILDQSNQVAGPEQRKGMTTKERKTETMAATAAAIIGNMFSKTSNVTIGTATMFDETGSSSRRPAKTESKPDDKPALDVDSSELVPWVRLKKGDQASGSASP
jgi:hypothetical protein